MKKRLDTKRTRIEVCLDDNKEVSFIRLIDGNKDLLTIKTSGPGIKHIALTKTNNGFRVYKILRDYDARWLPYRELIDEMIRLLSISHPGIIFVPIIWGNPEWIDSEGVVWFTINGTAYFNDQGTMISKQFIEYINQNCQHENMTTVYSEVIKVILEYPSVMRLKLPEMEQ